VIEGRIPGCHAQRLHGIAPQILAIHRGEQLARVSAD
jgi:hypothetical protein